jgi:hypothetical protein
MVVKGETMKDLIITIDYDTRKVKFNRDFIGLTGENLQGNIVVDFKDSADFVDGSASFEVEQNSEKYVISMEKDAENKLYKLPIKSSLLKYACTMKCQVVIKQEKTDNGVPTFKTVIFNMPCHESINALETIPEQYPSWVEQTEARLDALEKGGTGGGGGTSDYNGLINKPIQRADLTTIYPVDGTYYQHIGATTSDYIEGRIYFFNGNNYIAIDGYCSTLYTDYSFPESISYETFLKINNSVFTSYGEFNPAYITNGEFYGTVLSVSTVAPLSCEVLVNGVVYKYVYDNDNIITTKIDLKPSTWEHIATVTVEADTDGTLPTMVTISQDSDGNAFELTDFYVIAKMAFTDTASLYVNVNNNTIVANINNIGLDSNGVIRGFCMQYLCDEKKKTGLFTTSYSTSLPAAHIPNPQSNSQRIQSISPHQYEQYYPIKSISFYTLLGTAKTIVAGSSFELWGVRKK